MRMCLWEPGVNNKNQHKKNGTSRILVILKENPLFVFD